MTDNLHRPEGIRSGWPVRIQESVELEIREGEPDALGLSAVGSGCVDGIEIQWRILDARGHFGIGQVPRTAGET